MDTLCYLLLLLVPAILFWIMVISRLIEAHYHVPYPETERIYARTEDGFDLALYRHRPGKRLYQEPVVLCHGLGANRYNLDWPGHSLADAFAAAGFDTWVCELRGSGNSSKPSMLNDIPADFTFDDMVNRDLPAIIATVKAHAHSDTVAWVGHSMGGMAMYAYLGQGGRHVRAAFAISSPATFAKGNPMGAMLPLAPALKLFPVFHQRFFMRMLAPLISVYFPSPARALANPDNIDHHLAPRLFVNLMENMNMALLLQGKVWLDSGSLRSADGRIDYYHAMDRITVPFGFAVGSADLIATEKSVRDAYERCGSPDKTLTVMSRAQGFAGDYGHGDIVFCPNAHAELFPLVTQFMQQRCLACGDAPDR